MLKKYSKYEINPGIFKQLKEIYNRYGMLTLSKHQDPYLLLQSKNAALITRIKHNNKINIFFQEANEKEPLLINAQYRGLLKQACISEGFPVIDKVGYDQGSFFFLLLFAF
ncbi:MAG: hypothetical protein ABIA04_03320 [Pseudomonadota bacterium]